MKTRSNRKFLFSLVAGLLSLLTLGVGPTHSADYPPAEPKVLDLLAWTKLEPIGP